MSREIPPLRLDADTLFGIQPNRLNVYSRFESGLPQAESLISFRRVKRRNVSSSLWFHTLVVTAPFVSETSSLTNVTYLLLPDDQRDPRSSAPLWASFP